MHRIEDLENKDTNVTYRPQTEDPLLGNLCL